MSLFSFIRTSRAERRSTPTLEIRNDKGEGHGQASNGTGLLKVSLLHAVCVLQRWLSSHQKNKLSVWAWVSVMGVGWGAWVGYGLGWAFVLAFLRKPF